MKDTTLLKHKSMMLDELIALYERAELKRRPHMLDHKLGKIRKSLADFSDSKEMEVKDE